MRFLTKWEKTLSGFALLVFIVDAILCFTRHEIFGGFVSLFLGVSIVWNVFLVAIVRKETDKLSKLKGNAVVNEN